MNAIELRRKHAELVEAAEALIPKEGEPTDENRSAFDAKMAEANKVAEDMKRQEALDAAKAKLATEKAEERKVEEKKVEPRVEVSIPHSTRMFKTPEELRSAYITGRMFQSMFLSDDSAKKDEARRWLKDNSEEYRAAMSGSANLVGGTLVPDEFSNRVLDQAEQYGATKAACRRAGGVWPMSSDTLTVPRITSGLTVYHTGDGDASTESRPGTDALTLVAKKIGVLVRIPRSLIEDSAIDTAAKVIELGGRKLGEQEDDCAWNGDGSSTYYGIQGYRGLVGTASKCTAPGSANTVDNVGEVTENCIGLMLGTLPEWAENNAEWFCPKAVWGADLERLGRANGTASYEVSMGVKPKKMFRGMPVNIVQKVAAGTTDFSSAVFPLFYGDIGQALMFGERRGVEVRQSEHRYFEYDQIGIIVQERVDMVWVGIESTSAASAMVCLVGN